jgi:hypothetical protein
MPWRNWSVLIVLVLANYVVFSILATLVFPVRPQAPLMRAAQPTFTPGTLPLQRVGPLSYDFLTPSPIGQASAVSTRSTVVPTSTFSATLAATVTVTEMPTATSTLVVPPTSAVSITATATRRP